jgi:hypothetical protein
MLFEIWPIQAAMPLPANVGRLCLVQFCMARGPFVTASASILRSYTLKICGLQSRRDGKRVP